jgi:hypothetical protein
MMESALVLPLLVLLMIGVVDMANLLKVHSQLTRVVYEGARYGAGSIIVLKTKITRANPPSLDPANSEDVNSRMGEILRETGFDQNVLERSYQLCIRRGATDVDRVVQVNLRYSFQPLFMSFWGGAIPINISDDAPYLFPATALLDCT